MADKLNLGSEVRELKLGPSFSNNKGTAFHTLRYDFKPASVDPHKAGSVQVGKGHEVTVTVPNVGGSGTMQTVFKGSHRPYQRDCVLIIDKVTGEITLEKLTHNIQLKKTRTEQGKQSGGGGVGGGGGASAAPRPATPTEKKPSPPRPRGGGKKAKSMSQPVPKHSPLPASPVYPGKSPAPAPNAYKSPPQQLSALGMSPVGAAGSLPMIGLDDPLDSAFPSPSQMTQSPYLPAFKQETEQSPYLPVFKQETEQSPYLPVFKQETEQLPDLPVFKEELDEDCGGGAGSLMSRVGVVGLLSGSSSSSGSSDDSSDSDSDSPARSHPALKPRPTLANGHVNGNLQAADVLKADLELSESGSELD